MIRELCELRLGASESRREQATGLQLAILSASLSTVPSGPYTQRDIGCLRTLSEHRKWKKLLGHSLQSVSAQKFILFASSLN